ncbi:MAG: hypothetical protein JWQ09_2503 [Segetibacter sp.]|nr:hypothetical protein [Segetibacter sp.]
MNIPRNNLASADGSFLGYFFQIERVMLWLSELQENACVGVEVADDIVVQLANGLDVKEIYEQAKHTTGNTAPYSDKSEDLWKTLSIWIKAVEAGSVDPRTSKFSLLSNKPLPSNRIAVRLSKVSLQDEISLIECCEELINNADKLRNTLKTYGETVQNCSFDILKQIVSNIVILDTTYNHNKREFLKKLKGNLHLSDDMPIDHIAEKLFGFVSMYLIESWRQRKEGWISVKVFNQQFTQLVAEYKPKPFFEKASELLPVSKSEIKRNRGKLYVEQLRLIECDEDEVLESIHDYLRALTERDRFAKDGEISSDKLDQYFDDLLQNWKGVSKPRFKFCSIDEHVKTGYQVYYETLKYKGKLNNYEPEQHYTYKGAYHFLANELALGWHPKWKETLSK